MLLTGGNLGVLQHQMAPTFVGDSIHQSGEDKASEAMTGGSLLGEGMTEMPGLQAALAAASAAMQAEGQAMLPPAAPLQQHSHAADQVWSILDVTTALVQAELTQKYHCSQKAMINFVLHCPHKETCS